MSNAIELENVQYQAGKSFEIKNLSLRVPEGSIYGFLGPNGSGKTTTIRLFMGLLRARQGRIRVLGKNVPNDTPEILARTGYVPERPHVYHALTVAEALRYHAAFFPTWDNEWSYELVESLHLDPRRKIAQMSKGEKGKLTILLAIAQRPELLVLDEPTDGLDPVVRRDVLTAILDYVSHTNATVFISSHLIHELERFCDWVGVVDEGGLIAELPMDDFKNGIKKLRVSNPPLDPDDAPFVVLSRNFIDRRTPNPTETWVVRGWSERMHEYFAAVGADLQDVVDLDLEDGFVELLRSGRPHGNGNGNGLGGY
jgi:ABC-type multidrug transport system ATPase subunit